MRSQDAGQVGTRFSGAGAGLVSANATDVAHGLHEPDLISRSVDLAGLSACMRKSVKLADLTEAVRVAVAKFD